MTETMVGDNRPSVYFERVNGEPVMVIRCSALGHPCMWELIAAGQGVDAGPLPANMKRAFQEGHDAEPLIVQRLIDEHEFMFESAQEQEDVPLTDSIVVRYHPDGIADVPGAFLTEHCHLHTMFPERVVVEIKNLSHDLYEKAAKHGVESTIADYSWQLSVMMIHTGLPGLWVVRDKGYPPDKETGIKPPCEGEGRLYFQYVREPFVGKVEMRRKAIMIKEGVMGEDLLTSERACDTPNHFPCRFLAVRPQPESDEGRGRGVDSGAVLHVGVEDEKWLNQRVAEYLRHKGSAAEAGARADAIRDEIVARARELNGGTMPTEFQTAKWKVPVRESKSTRYDWDKMSPELKRAVEAYKRSRVTGHHVRDIERLDFGD